MQVELLNIPYFYVFVLPLSVILYIRLIHKEILSFAVQILYGLQKSEKLEQKIWHRNSLNLEYIE